MVHNIHLDSYRPAKILSASRKDLNYGHTMESFVSLLICLDAGEHGVPPTPNQSREQWRGQRRAGWGRLCHVIRGDCQGTVSCGVGRNDALGVCFCVPFALHCRTCWPLITPPRLICTLCQICREAEAAIFHQQLFEELRRLTPLSCDPTEVTAIGAVESSFKCCAGAIIVLTNSGRYTDQPSQRQKHILCSERPTNEHCFELS